MSSVDLDGTGQAHGEQPQRERVLGCLVYLSWSFATVAGPLLVFLIFRRRSPALRWHALNALRFQVMTLVVAALVRLSNPLLDSQAWQDAQDASFPFWILGGLVFLGEIYLVVWAVAQTIYRAVDAYNGRLVRYQFSLRFPR